MYSLLKFYHCFKIAMIKTKKLQKVKSTSNLLLIFDHFNYLITFFRGIYAYLFSKGKWGGLKWIFLNKDASFTKLLIISLQFINVVLSEYFKTAVTEVIEKLKDIKVPTIQKKIYQQKRFTLSLGKKHTPQNTWQYSRSWSMNRAPTKAETESET